MPAPFEEDDPLFGVGLLAEIEARMGAIVAGDAGVGQQDALQRASVIRGRAICRRSHYHVFALEHIVAAAGGTSCAAGAMQRVGIIGICPSPRLSRRLCFGLFVLQIHLQLRSPCAKCIQVIVVVVVAAVDAVTAGLWQQCTECNKKEEETER